MGSQLPLKGAHTPVFGMSIVAKRLDGRRRHLVRKQTSVQATFLAHVYCDQMAEWIKMSLGMEVDLGPGHIVLDGDPGHSRAPPERAQQPPLSVHVYCGQTVAHLSYC